MVLMFSGTLMLNYTTVTCVQHSIKMDFSLVFTWMNKKYSPEGFLPAATTPWKHFLDYFFVNRRQIFKDNCKYLILAVGEAVPGNVTFIILINQQLRCHQTAFPPHICIKSNQIYSSLLRSKKYHIYIWRKRVRHKTAPPKKTFYLIKTCRNRSSFKR